MIISKWKLPEEILSVIEESEIWERNLSETIDMCDIVNVAHILSQYKKDQSSLVPHNDKTLCFQKLFPGSSKISDCDEILKQANDKINAINN